MDDLMSNYKSESALSRLNRSAHFQAQKVPLDLYRAIEQAVRLSRLSGGKFDITVAPLVNAPKWLMSGAQVGEEVIFGADVFVYGLLILSEALKFARTLFREWKNG